MDHVMRSLQNIRKEIRISCVIGRRGYGVLSGTHMSYEFVSIHVNSVLKHSLIRLYHERNYGYPELSHHIVG